MAVPTVITDLNVSAGSNSPGDTEQAFPDNDNFLRAIQAFIRRPQAKGTSLASSTTVSIGGSTDGDFMDITHSTGATAISSFGTVAAGIVRIVRFVVTGGTLTITHNATSMILPSGQNITVTNNDMAAFRSLGSGNWICENYLGANGYFANLTLSSSAAVPLSVSTNVASTASVNIANTNAGNYAMSLNVIAAGTGGAFFQAYNNTSGSDFLGSVSWADSTAFTLNTGGVTSYNISSAKDHYFYGAAGTANFFFGDDDQSGKFLIQVVDGSNCLLLSYEPTLAIEGDTTTKLATASGGYKDHLSVESTGQHYADSLVDPGVLKPSINVLCSVLVSGTGVLTNNNGSYNIGNASVSDTSLYTFTFSALPTANYQIQATVRDSSTNKMWTIVEVLGKTTTSFAIRILSQTSGSSTVNKEATTFTLTITM